MMEQCISKGPDRSPHVRGFARGHKHAEQPYEDKNMSPGIRTHDP